MILRIINKIHFKKFLLNNNQFHEQIDIFNNKIQSLKIDNNLKINKLWNKLINLCKMFK